MAWPESSSQSWWQYPLLPWCSSTAFLSASSSTAPSGRASLSGQLCRAASGLCLQDPDFFTLNSHVSWICSTRLPSVPASMRPMRSTRRQVMALGLPLIQVVTVSELEAVVAHEFGHYAGGDARQAWVYRTREKIGRTLTTLRSGWRLLRMPFVLYGRLFIRVTQALSRRQEYAADQLAARLVGAQALTSGPDEVTLPV